MQQAIQLKLQDLKRLSLGINTKYLTLGILKNIQIALPAPEQQKEFAARVSDIRAMQAEQAISRRRLDELFHSMLHRAFQGEL
jgi:restriction endonuclease S subunit